MRSIRCPRCTKRLGATELQPGPTQRCRNCNWRFETPPPGGSRLLLLAAAVLAFGGYYLGVAYPAAHEETPAADVEASRSEASADVAYTRAANDGDPLARP